MFIPCFPFHLFQLFHQDMTFWEGGDKRLGWEGAGQGFVMVQLEINDHVNNYTYCFMGFKWTREQEVTVKKKEGKT